MKLTERSRNKEAETWQWFPDIPERDLWRINWKEFGYPYCGVYVITTDALYPCKIGISVNPVKRLNSLQTAHWRQLQISEYRWCVNQHEAKAVEKRAQERMAEAGKALLGEWVDCRPKEAVEAIDWAGVELSIEVNREAPKELHAILFDGDYRRKMKAIKENAPGAGLG